MKILDESGIEIKNPDLSIGYLKNDTMVVHHDAVKQVEEESHYEVISEYPNGGKDLKKVIDVVGVEAKDAYDENVKIQRYILYTEQELEQRFISVKDNKILESKTALSDYLQNHPLQWSDGKYYSVTSEKQSLLTSNLALYQISAAAGQPFKLTWNSTGDECVEWEYADLAALALAIGIYVKPFVSRQQELELEIKACKTQAELDAIEITYDIATKTKEEDDTDAIEN